MEKCWVCFLNLLYTSSRRPMYWNKNKRLTVEQKADEVTGSEKMACCCPRVLLLFVLGPLQTCSFYGTLSPSAPTATPQDFTSSCSGSDWRSMSDRTSSTGMMREASETWLTEGCCSPEETRVLQSHHGNSNIMSYMRTVRWFLSQTYICIRKHLMDACDLHTSTHYTRAETEKNMTTLCFYQPGQTLVPKKRPKYMRSGNGTRWHRVYY